MTIANGISPSDIPTVDLKILQATLRRRIATDSVMLMEINVELIRRDRSVDRIATVSGKIRPTESHVEQAE